MGEAKRKRDLGQEKPKDTRFVYGARCTWFGTIHEIGKRGDLPCCPHCRSMLFEMETEQEWWDGVDRFEAAGHPGYRKMVEWSRGKHFATPMDVVNAYEKATGIKMDLSPAYGPDPDPPAEEGPR